MKSKSFILMILSLGFGLVAAIGISQLMKANKATAQQPVQEMAPVLVAADVIGMKTILTDEHVRLENWPKSIVPEGVVTSLDDIKDMAAFKPLSKGAPIFKDDIRHKNESTGIQIPPGFKVVSIKVNAEDHGYGMLNPGDRVDIMGLFKTRNKKDGSEQTLTRTFLKALQVFSIDGRLSAVRDLDSEETQNSGNVIVGLLVTEKQAEQIFFVQRTGNIKLVFRGDPNESDNDVEDLEDIMNMENEAIASDDAQQANPGIDPQIAHQMVQEAPSMIVYKAGEPVKVIFEPGELPQQVGTSQQPAFVDPAMGPSDSQREADDDEDDFDGIMENDSDAEEDQ